MPGNGPYAGMGLYVIINNKDDNTVGIFLIQLNDSGDGGGNFYGTGVIFQALTNGQSLTTTPLGNSSNNGGMSSQVISGGTSSLPITKSISAASGVLTFTNDASTATLTGYFNGSPVGSIPFASWGPNPSLTLAVVGGSGYGIDVPAGTDTARNFYAGPLGILTPKLSIIPSGREVVLTWPTSATGFRLQSTTNLTAPVWSTNSPAPVVVNGQNTVTNPITGTQRYFRLSK